MQMKNKGACTLYAPRIECRPGVKLILWLGQAISSPMRRLKVDCNVDCKVDRRPSN